MLEDRASRLEHEREERTERAVAGRTARHRPGAARRGRAQRERYRRLEPERRNRSPPRSRREALTALGSIEHTGREALVEMRRLMGLLRPDAERVTRRSPQPGLHEVDTLVEQVREAGIPVLLTIEGNAVLSRRTGPVGLPDRARGLTNVLKHSRPSRVDVVVRYLPRSSSSRSPMTERISPTRRLPRSRAMRRRRNLRGSVRTPGDARGVLRSSAASSARGRCPAEGIACRPRFRPTRSCRDDPRPRCRRSAAHASRVRDDACGPRDIELVGEASDGLDAVEQARRLRPDVILMDVRMPGLDGVEATRIAGRRGPNDQDLDPHDLRYR